MPALRPLLAAAALLLVAAPAGATTIELGGAAPPGATGTACGACSYVQISTGTGAPAYRIPAGGGVITQWRVRGGPAVNTGDRVRLRVFRPGAPSGWFVVVAESADEAPRAGQVGEYGARVRVQGGESLGLRLATGGNTPAMFGAPAGNMVATWLSDPAAGSDTGGATQQADGQRANLGVRLESDNDRDGFGDDSQDSDDDNDGLSDDAERFMRTSTWDRDTDDDGLSDAAEERLGSDGRRFDTDRDGVSDGVEAGVRRALRDPPGFARGTNVRRFRRDLDPRTRTNPRRRDTDGDRLLDGREDRNRNGRRDRGETDPRRRDTDGDAVPDGAERFPLDRRR